MRVDPFVYDSLPQRVVFGAGTSRQVGSIVRELGASSAFVVADNAVMHLDRMLDVLDGVSLSIWRDVAQHIPVALAERARARVDLVQPEVLVAIGGGSSIGLAKAIALTHGLPVVAIPTTYAGSEQTTIYGLTGDRHKQTGKDARVLPKVVIYDPELTVTLPPQVTGPSAFNALAHSIGALHAPGHNPVTSALALEAVRAIRESLPAVMHDPSNVGARGTLQYGAFLAGKALGSTAAGLHHKICHVLGGTFNLVHAGTHSVILPHAVAFNARALPMEMAQLARALDVAADPAIGLWELAQRSRVPTSLADLGLVREALSLAASRAVEETTDNPRQFDARDLFHLLERAYVGARPDSSV